MIILREVIASKAAFTAILEVIPRNTPHFLVFSVSLQKRPTERKKIGVGHAVVFEDDPLPDMLKKPRDGATDPETATLIRFRVALFYAAFPIDFGIDQFSRFSDTRNIFGFIRAGPITGNEDTCRPHMAQRIHDLPKRMRSPPGDKQQWCGARHANQLLWAHSELRRKSLPVIRGQQKLFMQLRYGDDAEIASTRRPVESNYFFPAISIKQDLFHFRCLAKVSLRRCNDVFAG